MKQALIETLARAVSGHLRDKVVLVIKMILSAHKAELVLPQKIFKARESQSFPPHTHLRNCPHVDLKSSWDPQPSLEGQVAASY